MARTVMILFSALGLAVGCARPHGLADSPSPKPAEGSEVRSTAGKTSAGGGRGDEGVVELEERSVDVEESVVDLEEGDTLVEERVVDVEERTVDVEERAAAVGEAAEEGAIEAMVFPSSARVDEGRQRIDALRVRAWAPTPIGVLHEDARESYRIVLQAENVSPEAVEVHPAWARARIQRNDRIVEGCLSEPIEVPRTTAIGPEGSLFVSLPAPCALEEPGRYEVFVDLSIGVPFGTDGTAVRTARTEIQVQRRLEPFRGDELPPLTPDQLTPPGSAE